MFLNRKIFFHKPAEPHYGKQFWKMPTSAGERILIMSEQENIDRHLEDEQLISRFKSGDESAFDQLIDRHGQRMYQAAFALLNNHHDAEEVVQDAWTRAYRALKEFRGDSSIDTWLHRIVCNLSRNKYHWKRRRGSESEISLNAPIDGHENNLDEFIVLPEKEGSPEELMNENDTRNMLLAGINQLPDSVRETMMLRHVQELAYEEIAAIQECNIGTVKSRIARGRELLKKFLIENGIGE